MKKGCTTKDVSSDIVRLSKKEAILQAYINKRNLKQACESLDIGYSTVYDWIGKDSDFKSKFEHAQRIIGDSYIQTANKIADNTKHPMSATMNMFMIKRYHPEFRDNYQLQETITDGLANLIENVRLNRERRVLGDTPTPLEGVDSTT